MNPITFISDKIQAFITKAHIKSDVQMANQEFRLHRDKLLGWYMSIDSGYTFEVTGFTQVSINVGPGIAHTEWQSMKHHRQSGKNSIIWESKLIQCNYDPDNLLNQNIYRRLTEDEVIMVKIK